MLENRHPLMPSPSNMVPRPLNRADSILAEFFLHLLATIPHTSFVSKLKTLRGRERTRSRAQPLLQSILATLFLRYVHVPSKPACPSVGRLTNVSARHAQ